LKRAALSFVFSLIVLTLTVESHARPASPVNVVPAGSIAVLRMNWGAVRRAARLKEFIKGDDLERIMDHAGIDGGDVADLAIFLDIDAPANARNAMVMSGGPRLRAAADKLGAGGWREGSYRGYKFFSDATGANYLANLRSGFVALGTKSGLEAVIDAEQSPNKSILTDSRFRKLLAQAVATRHPVSLLMTLPQNAQYAGDVAVQAASFLLDFTSFAPLGKLLDKVGLARGVGVSMTHDGDSFPVSFVALMKDESAAGLISGAFSLLKGATSWLPAARDESESDRQMRLAFRNMTVTRASDVVSIRIKVPEAHLR
jgi:hypothetical protein